MPRVLSFNIADDSPWTVSVRATRANALDAKLLWAAGMGVQAIRLKPGLIGASTREWSFDHHPPVAALDEAGVPLTIAFNAADPLVLVLPLWFSAVAVGGDTEVVICVKQHGAALNGERIDPAAVPGDPPIHTPIHGEVRLDPPANGVWDTDTLLRLRWGE